MRAKLEILSGAKSGIFYLRLPSVIGRSGDAKIKLPAATVSRNHCELYLYEGQLVVRDLGSSNGTIVNGHRVDLPTLLTPEDELTIGPVTMRAILESEGTSAVAAAANTAAPALPASSAAADPDLDPGVSGDRDVSATDGSSAPPVASGKSKPAADSLVTYREDDDGSFLGINESTSTRQPSDSPFAMLGERPPRVEEDDSQLNAFFKNFE
jgi:predicted component of type VI protein secretion system